VVRHVGDRARRVQLGLGFGCGRRRSCDRRPEGVTTPSHRVRRRSARRHAALGGSCLRVRRSHPPGDATRARRVAGHFRPRLDARKLAEGGSGSDGDCRRVARHPHPYLGYSEFRARASRMKLAESRWPGVGTDPLFRCARPGADVERWSQRARRPRRSISVAPDQATALHPMVTPWLTIKDRCHSRAAPRGRSAFG